MSNMLGRFGARRLLLIAAAFAMVAAIACGTETSGGSVANAPRADDPPAAAEDISAAGDGDSETAAATGGINQECVQSVLGREASGFSDITAAERDRIFSECSGGSDIGDHTPRTGQFGQDHDSGDNSTFRFGGDGFTGQLPECFTDALGDSPNGFQGLSPEDFQAISEACGDEFGGFGGFGGDGGDFFGRGGDGGTGGFRGGGGFGGSLDLSSECVTNALGRTVENLQDVSAEERQQLFQTCFRGGASGDSADPFGHA